MCTSSKLTPKEALPKPRRVILPGNFSEELATKITKSLHSAIMNTVALLMLSSDLSLRLPAKLVISKQH